MSDKAECPACGSYSSTIRRAFGDGDPCPSCGLSADAAAEVMAIRRRDADAELTRRCEEATVRADRTETRVRQLEAALDGLQKTLSEALAVVKPGQ